MAKDKPKSALRSEESSTLSRLVEPEGVNGSITKAFSGLGRTKVTKEELIETIKKTRGLTYLASNVLGVDYRTLMHSIDTDPELTELLKEERGRTLDRAEAKLMQAVDKGEQWAITMILRTLGRERGYVERQEVASMAHVKLEIVEEIVDRGSKSIQVKANFTSPSVPESFIEDKSDD